MGGGWSPRWVPSILVLFVRSWLISRMSRIGWPTVFAISYNVAMVFFDFLLLIVMVFAQALQSTEEELGFVPVVGFYMVSNSGWYREALCQTHGAQRMVP
jgi:hypothetical protein